MDSTYFILGLGLVFPLFSQWLSFDTDGVIQYKLRQTPGLGSNCNVFYLMSLLLSSSRFPVTGFAYLSRSHTSVRMDWMDWNLYMSLYLSTFPIFTSLDCFPRPITSYTRLILYRWFRWVYSTRLRVNCRKHRNWRSLSSRLWDPDISSYSLCPYSSSSLRLARRLRLDESPWLSSLAFKLPRVLQKHLWGPGPCWWVTGSEVGSTLAWSVFVLR